MGTYPDGPSNRMAWDADGSVALHSESDNNGTGPTAGGFGSIPWTGASSSERIRGNDENPASVFRSIQSAGVADAHILMAILFPEPRELDGMYIVATAVSPTNFWMYKSQDTTNGIDGTWDNTVTARNTSLVLDHYRGNITSMVFPSVKSIKGNIGGTSTNDVIRWRSIHLYGNISPGQTPDRILFLDTANADAVFTKPINWNEIPRGQTQTRSFKIKNNSSGLTINTIQVTAEDLYLNAGNWYTFGDDNVNFQATFAVGNLGPGATKLLYLKQIIPDAETLGVQAGRIKVSHASVS